jgi:nicotinate-nucleotide adenylyltransferase
LFFLVGSDSLLDLPRWYRPEQIAALASLLVMVRPGTPTLTREELAARLGVAAESVRGVATVEAPQIDIASRDLRARAAAGRSLRYLVPNAVEAYIKDKRLYQQQT